MRLICEAEPSQNAFDVPNVQVISADSLAFHLLVRGDINPLLGRLGGLRVRDVTICEPEAEDLIHRVRREAAPGGTIKS